MKYSNEFSKIRKKIRKGEHDDAIDFLNALQNKINVKLDNLNRVIETTNKTCVDISERYLEVNVVDSNSHKITVNPVDGRVTLKISNRASEKVRNDLVLFAKYIKEFDDFFPVTYRGKIKFYNGNYETVMYSDSKKFKQYFRG